MSNYTVWLESGITVNLDDNIDPESTEGQKAMKKAAIKRFQELLDTEDIDINWESDD